MAHNRIRITSKFSSFTQFLRWIFVTLVGLFLQWQFALCGLSESNMLLPDQNYLHLISSAKYSPCNSLAPHMVVYAQLELKKATIAQNRDGGYLVRNLGVFFFIFEKNITYVRAWKTWSWVSSRLENFKRFDELQNFKSGQMEVSHMNGVQWDPGLLVLENRTWLLS